MCTKWETTNFFGLFVVQNENVIALYMFACLISFTEKYVKKQKPVTSVSSSSFSCLIICDVFSLILFPFPFLTLKSAPTGETLVWKASLLMGKIKTKPVCFLSSWRVKTWWTDVWNQMCLNDWIWLFLFFSNYSVISSCFPLLSSISCLCVLPSTL